jgi:LacI family transcriptional regulator
MRKTLPTSTIALLMPRANVHSRRLIRGITRYARPFKPWSFQLGLPEPAALPALRRWKTAGIILTSPHAAFESRLDRLGVPWVNCSSDLESDGAHRIIGDNRAVGRLAADHLLGLGYRHLAYCGDGSSHASRVRGVAFAHRCAAAGVTIRRFEEPAEESPLREVAWTRSGSDPALRAWLEALPKPVGVLACHDAMGVLLSEVGQHLGLRIPAQLAILGVDNDPELCELAYPTLSSIQTPQEQIGFEAARRLDALLQNRRPQPPILRLREASIVTRQSTGSSADHDLLVDTALRFITEHADQPIRVTDVVEHVGGSRRNLELRFNHATGRGVLASIQNAHLALARRLLAETDLTVEQVAFASGFNSRERFSTVFRQLTGLAPRAAYPRPRS